MLGKQDLLLIMTSILVMGGAVAGVYYLLQQQQRATIEQLAAELTISPTLLPNSPTPITPDFVASLEIGEVQFDDEHQILLIVGTASDPNMALLIEYVLARKNESGSEVEANIDGFYSEPDSTFSYAVELPSDVVLGDFWLHQDDEHAYVQYDFRTNTRLH